MHRSAILIVDDDPEAVHSFSPILTAHGYDARPAVDADSAFKEIEHSAPAAILLDLHLPVIDGLECLRRLRSTRHAAIPVAVITGDYLIDDWISAELRMLGSRLYFKPLWDEDIVRIVGDLLEIHGGADGNRDLSTIPVCSNAVGA